MCKSFQLQTDALMGKRVAAMDDIHRYDIQTSDM